ncbi:MAG: hypothetical protein JW384_00314 [Nitrosomonadaceae bacterium]|nr:hypothetical protein [Nitrosomonadaceae bacterium]
MSPFFQPPLVQRSGPQLSFGVIIFFAFAALVLPGCIHINVIEGSGDSRSNKVHAIYQDPESPGQIIEPIDPSAIPADLPGCNDCQLDTLINHRQQTGSWCWAASTRTVTEFIRNLDHDDANDQCELVNTVFEERVRHANLKRATPSPANVVNCCKAKRGVSLTEPGSRESRDICDQGRWPDTALENPVINPNGMFLNIFYPPFDDLQGWDDLTGQISRKLPFLTVVRWAGGGRHAVAIGGYSIVPGEGEYVHVYDPGEQEFSVMLFQDFYHGIRGRFEHERDYFNIGQ